MEKNNQCQCYPPVWLEWENQMEPGHTCEKCQREEYEHQQSLEREELSPLMQRLIAEAEEKARYQPKEVDDLPF